MLKRQQIAEQFLSQWFGLEDTFALLVRHPESSRTLQRIVRLPELMKSNYLGWLAFENSCGANIYFSINPLAFGPTKRTKSAIVTAKGLYLDLDSDGEHKLAALRDSNAVPPPSAVIHTSIGKYQVIWRVRGFTIPGQEAMLKGLAEAFGGDRACTDCARVFRLPGFFNRKYTPAFPVTSEMHAIQLEYSPSDFRLELPTVAAVQPSPINQPRWLGSQTRSECNWRWVMAQLDAGIPAQEIAQTLANIRCDKPNPYYYAHWNVDIATAVRWVRRGVDFGSVIEGLREHVSALSTIRAAETPRPPPGLFSEPESCTPRRIDMPLLEITQSRQISASVRLDEATATQVDQYAAFIKASADDVVDKALNYVFSKDRDFQDFLKTPEAKQISATLRVRKAPSTEVVEQPAKKAVGVTASVEPVRTVKA